MCIDAYQWYQLVFIVNWPAVLIIGIVLYAIQSQKLFHVFPKGELFIDEITLGIGNNKVKMSYSRKDQEIAFKLWVEISTRKVGRKFDPENDVIIEVYNSWYAFFGIARNLLKEIPAERIKNSIELIKLTQKVLNLGLRPHLTRWQARFRKWYSENSSQMEGKTPQEIQRQYPEYDALLKDILETNEHMMEYERIMKTIALSD